MKFIYLLIVSATILVCSAAYFSVTGFAQLFSGAFISIVILISGLEFAKLTVTSFLYRYWDSVSKIFKVYLLIVVATLMIITSAGIYGFLSAAYSVTVNELSKIEGVNNLYEKKIEIIQNNVNNIKSVIKSKNERMTMLVSLRANQESRIDTLYKKGMIKSVRRTEDMINNANYEINNTNKIVDSLNNVMSHQLDSVSKIDLKMLELKSNVINGDIGPLKYIATLTGKSIDSVVNFFILLLVFISDPLSACLVIASNKVLLENKNKEKPIKQIEQIKKQIMTKREIILKNYLKICKEANESEIIFDSFKIHPHYHEVLEHLSKDLGKEHLKLIQKNNAWLLSTYSKEILQNDLYGSPVKEDFGVIKCSPTTLQYVSVISNLIDKFKSLDKFKIVEIGGGYGGQCKLIQDMFDIESYTIIDLAEVLLLQEKYLRKLDSFESVYLISNSELSKASVEYDLAISNYALTEVSFEDQDKYVKEVLLNCKHGYITGNQPLSSIALLIAKFPTFKVEKDIKGERDENYLITW
jgi:hypothetical protein